MAILVTNAVQVARFANALYGIKLGSTTNAAVNADIANIGLSATVNAYYDYSFGSKTSAEVAAIMLGNLGLTGNTAAAAYVEGQLNAAGSAKGVAVLNMLNAFSNLESDATFGAAATAWNATIVSAQAYTASNTADVAATATTTQTFTLTTGVDYGTSFTGGAGNDTFNALADGLLTTGDALTGGAGTDTLTSRHTITADTSIAPTTSGIEVLKVRLDHDGGAADAVTYSMVDVSGATEVQSYRSVNSGSTADAVLTFSGAGMTTGVTLAIVGGDSGADNSSIDVTATYQSVTGAADSANLRLDGAAANVVTIANIETLNITTATTDKSVSSTGASTLNTLTATSASKVNITATGTLTLSATDFAATVAVDASASTGAVNFTAESGNNLTYTGGAGADKVTIGALSNLTAADQLTGGAGTDTLKTSDTAISTGEQALLATETSGFERLEFSATSSVTVDMTDLSIFDTIVFSGATTGATGTGASGGESGGNVGTDAHTVSGIDTGDSIIITGAVQGGAGESISARTAAVDAGDGGDALVLTPELDNGSNSISITFSANITGGTGGSLVAAGASAGSGGDGGDAISASSFETVTLITTQNSTASLTSLAIAGGTAGADATGGTGADGNDGYSVVVGTNGKIVVQGAIDLNLGTIAGTNATVDANAFTGDLTVVLEAGANTFIGGSGDDVVTGANGLDTYTLGAGADRVNIGVEATTTASDAPANGTSFESITDFNIAVDVLNFLAADETALTETIVTNTTAVVGTAAINAEGIASFASADDTLAERVTAVEAAIATGTATEGQMAVFEYAGSTYVFVSNGGDGVEAGDVLVKLTGVTGVTTTTFDDNGYLVLG